MIPIMSFDVALNKNSAVRQVLDWRESLERELLNLNFGLIVHEDFDLGKIELCMINCTNGNLKIKFVMLINRLIFFNI